MASGPRMRSAPEDVESRHVPRVERLIDSLPRRMRRPVRWLRKPSSRWARIPAGLLLTVGGLFGMLPLLGFWMLPLGLLLLAEDVPPLRRSSGRVFEWMERWRSRRLAARED